jgi:hypothetical protein
VHEVVRHLVDTSEIGAARLRGDSPRFPADGPFDPRTTPVAWLAESEGRTPAETVAVYGRAIEAEIAAVEQRLAGGDDSPIPWIYGAVHWSVAVSHIFWDAWLHERDILLPRGRPDESTPLERRVAALYGLLICAVSARFGGAPLDVAIDLGETVVQLGASDGSTWARELPAGADVAARGDLGAVVDAVAGRDADVAQALDAPADVVERFGWLRVFMT